MSYVSGNLTKTQVKELIESVANRSYGVTASELSNKQLYRCVATVVRDLLLEKRSAFNKVYKQYKSTVEQAIEKEKWFKAFSEAKENLERIQYSWKGTAEEHQVLKQYNKLYGKISKNIK